MRKIKFWIYLEWWFKKNLGLFKQEIDLFIYIDYKTILKCLKNDFKATKKQINFYKKYVDLKFYLNKYDFWKNLSYGRNLEFMTNEIFKEIESWDI